MEANRIDQGEGCRTSLLKLEEQMLVAAHKFGVIFARENQITENELFSNSAPCPFLNLNVRFITKDPHQEKETTTLRSSSSFLDPRLNWRDGRAILVV